MDLSHLQRVGLSVLDGAPCRVLRPKAARVRRGTSSVSPCNLLGCCGFASQFTQRSGRAPWIQPAGGVDMGIVCTNSLTNEKERFVPLQGKKVRWYTCGPTVYDVSHMGHARAYLTFDILRRIMQDYFGYELVYQINITDIDDKIIMRSRQNKLLAEFHAEAEEMTLPALKEIVDEAVDLAGKKLAAKCPQAPAANASEKDKQEFEKLTKEHKLKLDQHSDLVSKVASAAGSKPDLLEVAKDPLMAKLDEDRGHTVNDHSIFDGHARRFEKEYFDDMDALGVLRPDVVTRISEFMDGRVQVYIKRLVDRGFAYESNGSVYFDIESFKKEGYNYRKLSPAANASAAEMAEGEGALVAEASEKRNPNDFAIWKASKPGEPAWDSEWGKGRPGWHIECSVMADEVHKEYLDIHAGGEDLKFPHHDNEIAQSEAYNGRPQWTNYFWHAGHLSIEGLKMSKSLKNFITIRQALKTHTARQLRLMFLMQSWDKSMNYSDQAIEMAKVEERKLKHFLGTLKFHQRRGSAQEKAGEREAALESSARACETAVGAALRDNFNTAKVVELISKLVSECYPIFEALPKASLAEVEVASNVVCRTMGVLGVVDLLMWSGDEWCPVLDAYAGLRQQVRQLARTKAPAADVVKAAEAAEAAAAAARKSGLVACADSFESFIADVKTLASQPAVELLKRCDVVRDKDFPSLGVRLEDLGAAEAGFVWMFEDKDALAREFSEQAEKTAAAAAAKLANKLTLKRTELKAAERQAVEPALWFKSGQNADLYVEFDENGVPSKTREGEEISAKKKKDFAKELAKQQKDYEKLLKQAGGSAEGILSYLRKLRSEVEATQEEEETAHGLKKSSDT